MDENETPRKVVSLIRLRDAAKRLGRSKRSIHRLIAAGLLTARTDNGMIYIESASIDAYIASLPVCRKLPQDGKEPQ